MTVTLESVATILSYPNIIQVNDYYPNHPEYLCILNTLTNRYWILFKHNTKDLFYWVELIHLETMPKIADFNIALGAYTPYVFHSIFSVSTIEEDLID